MTVETLEKTLAAHPLVEGLSAPQVAALVGCASSVKFGAGEFIFREGEPADRFYVLRQGVVGVEVGVPGHGPATLDTLETGDVLGWSWLFPPYRAHFDARALSLVRALAIDGACLRTKCDQDPALGYRLIQRFAGVMIQRLEATRVQLLDMYGERP